ncbi:cytochrome-c peroxidase [Caminibacter profundus]
MKIISILMSIVVVLLSYDIKPLYKIKTNKDKVLLGKKLFFDKNLSKHKDISCNSCHIISNYGVDNKQFSIGSGGVIDTPMNTPTVYNVAFNIAFEWNGGSDTLQKQTINALTDKKEHNLTIDEVEKIVNSNKNYVKEFIKIYGKKPTINEITDAIAEYEKSLITLNSKFDKYLQGEIKLTEEEKRGYMKFKIYGCITCHNGVNVGGNSFQKVGLFIENIDLDRGFDRYEVTKNPMDIYVYKVPSLRNVEKTYPYFHDGSVKTLKEAIKKMGQYNLGIVLSSEDIDDIESFLKTLTGKINEK